MPARQRLKSWAKRMAGCSTRWADVYKRQEYMLKTTLVPRFGGKTSCDEIGLPVSATGGVVPCGATAIWEE